MQKVNQCLACESTNFRSFIKTLAQMHPSDQIFNFDQCENCGLVFLNPRVPPEDLKNYYTDFYLPYRGANAWGKYRKQVESSQLKLDQKRYHLVNQHAKLSNKSVLLDIGCGKPDFLQKCYDQSACQGIGIDFSDEGWKNQAQSYQNLDLKVAEVKDLDADLKVDAITMWHYLEHDYTPIENLKRLKKHTHSNTKLIIEVPNFDSSSRKKYGSHWAGYHTPRHTALYTPDTITTLLENSGWQAKVINSYGTLDPYVLTWMSKMEQKGIQWNKNMEEEFFGYVAGMISFLPQSLFQKSKSLGIMTVVAQPV